MWKLCNFVTFSAFCSQQRSVDLQCGKDIKQLRTLIIWWVLLPVKVLFGYIQSQLFYSKWAGRHVIQILRGSPSTPPTLPLPLAMYAQLVVSESRRFVTQVGVWGESSFHNIRALPCDIPIANNFPDLAFKT